MILDDTYLVKWQNNYMQPQPTNFEQWPEDAQQAYLAVSKRAQEAERLLLLHENPASDDTLINNEFWLWNLFRKAHDGYCLCDINGQLIDGNLALREILGYPAKKNLMGLRLTELVEFSLPQQDHINAMIEQVINNSNNVPPVYELNFNNRAEKFVTAEVSMTYMEVRQRHFLLCIFHDISQRKQIEQELENAKVNAEHANRAKNAFLNNISHELRTPLTAILGYAELLMEDAEDAGEAQMYADLQNIYLSAQHLYSLIGDILDLARIETKKIFVTLSYFNPCKIIDEVVATLNNIIKQNKNELILKCNHDMGAMYSDKNKVSQIIFNLLSNAAKFTELGTITLEGNLIEKDGQTYLEIIVEDTGIGIAQENLDRIFEHFQQEDDSLTRPYEGAGLGLTITRHYINMLNGSIIINSEVGQGTRLEIMLPWKLAEELNWH